MRYRNPLLLTVVRVAVAVVGVVIVAAVVAVRTMV